MCSEFQPRIYPCDITSEITDKKSTCSLCTLGSTSKGKFKLSCVGFICSILRSTLHVSLSMVELTSIRKAEVNEYRLKVINAVVSLLHTYCRCLIVPTKTSMAINCRKFTLSSLALSFSLSLPLWLPLSFSFLSQPGR